MNWLKTLFRPLPVDQRQNVFTLESWSRETGFIEPQFRYQWNSGCEHRRLGRVYRAFWDGKQLIPNCGGELVILFVPRQLEGLDPGDGKIVEPGPEWPEDRIAIIVKPGATFKLHDEAVTDDLLHSSWTSSTYCSVDASGSPR